MLKLGTKVSALIRDRVGSQNGRKEDKETKKIQKQARRKTNEERKAEKKRLKKQADISWPVPHAPTSFLDNLGTHRDYDFNHVLDHQHTPLRSHPPPVRGEVPAVHEPDHDRGSENDSLDRRVAFYLSQQQPSQISLRITNGAPTPSTSTETFASRLATAANQATAAEASQDNIANSQPRRPFLSEEFSDEDEEISPAKGLSHNPNVSEVPEHGHIVSDAAKDALRQYECDTQAAHKAKLRDTLLAVNPLLADDAPLDGIPTLHGDGSRFHQYSRPDTFSGPSQSNEQRQTQAARDPCKRPANPVSLTLQSFEGEEDEERKRRKRKGREGEGEATTKAQNATRSSSHDKAKRHGRVFYNSELPQPLRIGYTDPAGRPVTHLSARDEADLHFSSAPFTQRPATPSRPPFRVPTPPQHPLDPDLAHAIDHPVLPENVQSTPENPDDFLTPLLPITRRASPFSTTSHQSHHDHDPRLHRNASTEILSLPGHYGTGHLALPSQSPSPSSTPRSSYPSIRSSYPSIRSSLLSISTDSTDTKSLRNKLVHILSEHSSKHPNPSTKSSSMTTPETGSSDSLFRKVADIVAMPGHYGRSFGSASAPTREAGAEKEKEKKAEKEKKVDKETATGAMGPVMRSVRAKTSADILRPQPSHENLRLDLSPFSPLACPVPVPAPAPIPNPAPIIAPTPLPVPAQNNPLPLAIPLIPAQTKTPSPSSTLIRKTLRHATKSGWRKIWQRSLGKGQERERKAMEMILFDAIGPAVEAGLGGLGREFEMWGR